MSLIPSSVQGAPTDNYFPASTDGFARNLTILETADPALVPGTSAVFSMTNGGGVAPMTVVHYVNAVGGGGLVPGQYQVYMYGPSIGAPPVGELFMGQGLGNTYCSLSFNSGFPLDAARIGKITGTGAPQVIAVPSITAGSSVALAFVGGTPAAADVAIAVAANTSFTLTLPAGAVYNYTVVG